MFPPAALEGLIVVDVLVRFLAFDLPFELPFLAIALMVGRLIVLPFGSAVVFEIVDAASVLVLVLIRLVVVSELDVVRDASESVVSGLTIIGNTVVVLPV